MLLLVSCGAKTLEDFASDSSETSQISEPNRPTERNMAQGAKQLAEHLYEISDLIPERENMSLTDFAMRDDTHLLLLYKENLIFGEGDPAFTLSLLDLETGKGELLHEHTSIAFPEGEVVDFYMPSLVSVDPPIVSENYGGTVYFPENRQGPGLRLDGGRHINAAFYQNGALYLLTSQGELLCAKGEKDVLQTEVLWKKDIRFGDFAVSEISGDRLILSLVPLADQPPRLTYLSLGLSDGGVREAYTLEDGDEDAFRFAYRDALVLKEASEGGVWDLVIRRGGEKTVSDFPKEGSLKAFYENGWMTPSRPSENSIAFIVRGSEDEHIFLWDFGFEPKQTVRQPVKTPYDLSALPESADAFAASIEERYGVKLALRDSAKDGWDVDAAYTITPELDEERIYATLAMLSGALSKYPDGFFAQLGSRPLRIGIVNEMIGIGAETVSYADGLTIDGDPGQMLIHTESGSRTIHHEIGHVIFNKLCHEGFRNDMMGLFNELNPKDFIYSFSYDEDDPDYAKYTPLAEDTDETYANVYFVSNYAKISNTEDAAEMIGNLMQETAVPECFRSPHLRAKCEFFFERIRLAFDSRAWQEQTYWEKRLAEAESNKT